MAAVLFLVGLIVVAAALVMLLSDWSEFGDGTVRIARCTRIASVVIVVGLVAIAVYSIVRYGIPTI